MTEQRYDLAVRGGTLVTPAGRFAADVAVANGRIAALVAPGTPLEADREIDASGRHVLPGVIDVHSHHREPGFTHKEDIVTATSACAAGGVTTSFAMPNVDPPPNTAERLDAILELYAAKALVDWNVNAAGTVPDEIPAMATRGIAAFKVFMVVDTGRSYPHMPGIGVHDHGDLMNIFEVVGGTGLPLMVHPHDQALMTHIERQFWDRGEHDFRAYAKAYSAYDGIIWDVAAAVLIRIQKATGTRLHLLHTQTEGVVEQLRRAKSAGQAVTAELNPWAVFLGNDWANIERLGSYALSYYVPEKNTEPLWQALRDGTIDLVSTDHAPHTREEKEPGWTDGWKAHTGTPSTQFYVPLLLDAASSGRITLERVVELTSAAPARAFGLGTKGRLEVGADADLAIVDLERRWTIRDADVVGKIDWTPYADRELRGAIDRTIVRGRVVYEDGRVVGEPGWGRQARPVAVDAAAPEPVTAGSH
ncbi:MAG TPA: dihydroorotase family protein [Candidatus Limnocylindrales bacterium]|nr:dihydroorotase family protein [Candidatus Limnocylindrales bacterium]